MIRAAKLGGNARRASLAGRSVVGRYVRTRLAQGNDANARDRQS